MMKFMKRILATITIIATLFLGAAYLCPAHAQEELSQQEEQKEMPPLVPPKGDFSEMRSSGISRVVEVINPMTIKLKDGRMISLAGLDYPDLDFYDPGELAVTAQKVLEDFLIDKKVIVYQTPQSDRGRMNRMGHHIAHLARFDDDDTNDESSAVWVEGLMLSLGLARVRTTKYNRQMAAQMQKLENDARALNLGLWDMKSYAILTPEEATKHIGSYQIVEGTIQNVGMHKNNLYINFGNNWRKDFTLGISGTTLRSFSKEKIDPHKWNGLKVRVRGWIESYNGPFIEINHPERIELLSPQKPEETKKEPNSQEDSPITFDGTALPGYNH